MSRARYLTFRRTVGPTPPLTRQTVRVRGLSFAVFTTEPIEGQPPLLCVNGGLMFDHRLLWPAMAPLASRRQLILYDQRGRGESEAPDDPMAASIEDDAADVPALRRALGIRRWDVLGHSWGGGLAMLAVASDQSATRRLVLVDAVGPRSSWFEALRDTAMARGTDDDRAMLSRISTRDLERADLDLHADHARALHRGWFADPSLADHLTAPRAQSLTGAAVSARLRGGYDWRLALRALSTPTLVMHGEQDALPLDVARELTALLPKARLELLPDAGHMPFWEAPELFFSLAESFLAGPPPA
jgi:proline iminopeptidase